MTKQNKPTKNFLDLLPEESRKVAIERAERRIEKKQTRKGLSVPPEFYAVAEMGYYYGWEAVLAMRRGYTQHLENIEEGGKVTGLKVVNEPLTTVEAEIILEGARKVGYSKLVEQSSGNQVAFASSMSKTPRESFESGMKPFTERAKVE